MANPERQFPPTVVPGSCKTGLCVEKEGWNRHGHRKTFSNRGIIPWRALQRCSHLAPKAYYPRYYTMVLPLFKLLLCLTFLGTEGWARTWDLDKFKCLLVTSWNQRLCSISGSMRQFKGTWTFTTRTLTTSVVALDYARTLGVKPVFGKAYWAMGV